MESKFKKWDRWLDSIYNEVRILAGHWYIFNEVSNIIENNKKIHLPSAFYYPLLLL